MILNEIFHTEIVHFERKQWPTPSNSHIATADAVLDREYQKQWQQRQSRTKDEIEEGAVSADHLADAETAWERYRTAWSTFARLRYPASASAIRAQITLHRYRLIKTIS